MVSAPPASHQEIRAKQNRRLLFAFIQVFFLNVSQKDDVATNTLTVSPRGKRTVEFRQVHNRLPLPNGKETCCISTFLAN